jgi:hypothetical protein
MRQVAAADSRLWTTLPENDLMRPTGRRGAVDSPLKEAACDVTTISGHYSSVVVFLLSTLVLCLNETVCEADAVDSLLKRVASLIDTAVSGPCPKTNLLPPFDFDICPLWTGVGADRRVGKKKAHSQVLSSPFGGTLVIGEGEGRTCIREARLALL